MSRATPDDQLKFLLNCVKHSNNGKIDFVEVAKECGIVSKGAAAKRYERLMKANGIHPNGGLSDKPMTPTAPREKSRAAIAKAAASKKRKIEGISGNVKADDDDDGMPTKSKAEPKEIQRVKPESKSSEKKSPLTIKSPSPPAATPTPPPIPVQFLHPPRPQQLFSPPQMVYTHPRPYHPHMAHMAHYPGPLMPLPPPPLSPPPPPPSPMSQCPYPMHRPSIAARVVPNFDDTSIFEEFCTPELFENRTFLEMPAVEKCASMPPPPQEVTMKDLSIEENDIKKKQEEHRSGRRPSESILIID